VAKALTAAGYPISPKTLATKASRGGGRPFRKWSNRPLYAWGSALTWAQSRLGPLVTSTSELDGKDRQPGAMHSVAKVVSDAGTIGAHACRLTEQKLAGEPLSEIREGIATTAARIALAENIESRLRQSLTARPERSCAAASADIINRSNPE